VHDGREAATPVGPKPNASIPPVHDLGAASVMRLFAGPDADIAHALREVIIDEHVPFLAQFRYHSTAHAKRLLWEKAWDLQREEDRTGPQVDIEVPPKYKKEDFLRISYWNQRGKLDVPRERFISYPGAWPDGDDSLLLGWAGWDYREQALALIELIEVRLATAGWRVERLTPLLAGLLGSCHGYGSGTTRSIQPSGAVRHRSTMLISPFWKNAA